MPGKAADHSLIYLGMHLLARTVDIGGVSRVLTNFLYGVFSSHKLAMGLCVMIYIAFSCNFWVGLKQ